MWYERHQILILLLLLGRDTDFYEKALHVLSENEFDLPFVLMYSVDAQEAPPNKWTAGEHKHGTRSQTTSVRLTLQGSVGVPEGHPSAPAEFTTRIDTSSYSQPSQDSDTTSSTASFSGTTSSNTTGDGSNSWPFQEALSSRKPVFIADLAGRNKGFIQRGWPSEVKHAVVIPLMADGESSAIPKACIIVGLNSRRPWNEVFATFLNLLARNLSMGLLNVTVRRWICAFARQAKGTDETLLRQMAESEAKRTEELVQLDRAKTVFFSNVSHELRTPLTLILGPLEDVLSNKHLAQDDKDRLVTVQRHANRLLNMVNTLLDFCECHQIALSSALVLV